MEIDVKSWIKDLGGKPTPKLINLLTETYCFFNDEILKTKLLVAFNANLPVDYVYLIIKSHVFVAIDCAKKKDDYSYLGQILTNHFSNKKILQILNSLDAHSYFFYLDTIQPFYDFACLYLNAENLDRKMHRHIKNFKQLATVLHDLMDCLLSPDQELDIQRQLFFAINNRFLTPEYQIYIPVRYKELKEVSYIFNNCLGSPMMKKQLDDKDFAIVVIKKENNFIAVMDLKKDYKLNNIKGHFNVNFIDSDLIRESWDLKLLPFLMKNSLKF